ncbi:MAG: hypothetical protein NVSMB64_05320 [Candidatus Velthaea sp.]
MNTGLCRNPACTNAVLAQPIPRYPGAGEFCPDCGELLLPSFENAKPADALRIFKEPGALETLPLLPGKVPGTPPASAPEKKRGLPPRVRAAMLPLGVIIALLGIAALLRLGAPARATTLHVCTSDLTARAAHDIVRAYARRHTSGLPLEITNAGACDVRFVSGASDNDPNVIARDGIVAVVNPQNPIAKLDARVVRDIFSGARTDWSRVGGAGGTIVPLIADENSDETRAARATLLRDAAIAPGVQRLRSSADIVRAVAGASGRNLIGIVAFSAAVPAKVLAIEDAQAPSAVSIADRRYPYTVAIAIEDASHAREGEDLIRFAQSDEAQSSLVADGLVGKGRL